MESVQYTAIYQMTYLLIEEIENGIFEQKVSDSLQVFIFDLEKAVKEDGSSLEAVKDSITDYFVNAFSHKYMGEDFLPNLRKHLSNLGMKEETVVNYFSEIIEEAKK